MMFSQVVQMKKTELNNYNFTKSGLFGYFYGESLKSLFGGELNRKVNKSSNNLYYFMYSNGKYSYAEIYFKTDQVSIIASTFEFLTLVNQDYRFHNERVSYALKKLNSVQEGSKKYDDIFIRAICQEINDKKGYVNEELPHNTYSRIYHGIVEGEGSNINNDTLESFNLYIGREKSQSNNLISDENLGVQVQQIKSPTEKGRTIFNEYFKLYKESCSNQNGRSNNGNGQRMNQLLTALKTLGFSQYSFFNLEFIVLEINRLLQSAGLEKINFSYSGGDLSAIENQQIDYNFNLQEVVGKKLWARYKPLILSNKAGGTGRFVSSRGKLNDQGECLKKCFSLLGINHPEHFLTLYLNTPLFADNTKTYSKARGYLEETELNKFVKNINLRNEPGFKNFVVESFHQLHQDHRQSFLTQIHELFDDEKQKKLSKFVSVQKSYEEKIKSTKDNAGCIISVLDGYKDSLGRMNQRGEFSKALVNIQNEFKSDQSSNLQRISYFGGSNQSSFE